LKAIIPPLALVLIVLGSIFSGIATPTESSALGGVGAVILSLIYRQFSWKMLFDSALETVKVTAMVFAILMGATAFSMAFSYTGGDYIVEEALLNLPGEKWGFIILAMVAILILGFFIDFVEIAFIIVPILAPVAEALGINMVWFAILIAMNLQTSFLTPPFGFSLFYLKGVAPRSVKTFDIYRGVIPFILIQIAVLVSILVLPGLYGMD
ncbi:MAG: TRAP transporter large permease subunit, partial [Pseudomonadota bacterium]|nr:TRAP transporter large permease subunit [Pseudomonadota bacterium]